jgi:flagellar hook-length control protein FliK
VREARGGLIHPEILAAMEPVRKRTPRTALDPIISREPAAPETVRTVPPAHAGAAAIPLSDSRAADLQKLIDTFDRHMLSMVQQGDKMTRVTLNSREMGRLTVVCHEETSGLKIEIQAQNSAVQAALQRHETAVRQLLQAHGSAVGKFDVTCGDGRNTDPRRFGRGRGFFEEFPDGGIEPACSAGNEIEPLMARAPAHAVSIFA